MKMSLKLKMVAYFLLVILVAVAGFAYTIYSCNQAESNVSNLNKYDVPFLDQTWELSYNVMSETANLRAYFIYGDQHYFDQYKKASESSSKIEQGMIEQVRTEKTRRMISEIKELNDQYSKIAEEKCVPLIKAGKKEEVMQIFVSELAPIGAKTLAKLDEAKTARKNSISLAMNETVSATKQAKMVAMIVAVLVAMIGTAIGLFAARKITAPVQELQGLMAEASEGNLQVKAVIKSKDEIGQLCQSFNKMIVAQFEIVMAVRDSAVELTAASEEMAASSTEVSMASSSIAEEIQDVAHAMQEAFTASVETGQVLIQLSSLIEISKDKATLASASSKATIDVAREGKDIVTEVIQSMNTIYNKTVEAEKIITLLNEYSEQIGIINETISGIAKQTNLLALNAAIEAARAGEAGKGFAVVAEEVRKLAEQSNTEAGNISQLINKITEKTSNAVVAMKHSLVEVEVGVGAVNKAEVSLENILVAVREIVGHIDGIVDVTNDEVASSDKIVQLIEDVTKNIEKTERDAQMVAAATEEVNATMETIAASSEQTSAMAQSLQNEIIKFKV